MESFKISLMICVIILCITTEITKVNCKWITFEDYMKTFMANKTEMAEIVGVSCNDRRRKRDEAGICRLVY